MVRALKRYGQNFLEAPWADKVVAAIAPRPDDRFLEIGPGHGALTLRLAPLVRQLTAVEVDREMVESLTPNLPPNARVIHADFLDLDLRALAEGAGGPLRVAGNLPYNVSSPILFKLLEFQRGDGRDVLVDATLMLQREVAERMTAQAGTGEYGVLSIFVQLQADVRRVLALPPGAFRPAPKVHSAVVRLAFRPPPVDVGDFRRFETMVRTMFTQRRKTLNNALRPFAEASATDPATLLSRAGIDPRRRPETLQLSELAELARAVL